MKGREIHDLHGNKFIVEDYKISGLFPILNGKRVLCLTSDVLTHTSFVLIKYENGEFLYVMYENSVYVYGRLRLIGYIKENDIRHGK